MIVELCSVIEDISDREFMLQLYQTYKEIMFYTAKRYIRDQYTCEVIVQDSIIKLITKIPYLKNYNQSFMAGYIVLTVKHIAFDYLRREKKERDVCVDYDEHIEQAKCRQPSIEWEIISVENRKALAKVWKKLSEEDRILLERKYILECTDKEISEFFKCKPQSVRMKLTRARRNALELMRNEGII